jgi:hypothetical protein
MQRSCVDPTAIAFARIWHGAGADRRRATDESAAFHFVLKRINKREKLRCRAAVPDRKMSVCSSFSKFAACASLSLSILPLSPLHRLPGGAA